MRAFIGDECLMHTKGKGETMKHALVRLVAALLSVGLIGPAFAQRQAPKSTDLPPKAAEKPDGQQEKSKATAGEGARKGKKPDASIDERKGKDTGRPPMGTEGPETRKGRKPDASAKPQKSKGAAGTAVGKEQKAP